MLSATAGDRDDIQGISREAAIESEAGTRANLSEVRLHRSGLFWVYRSDGASLLLDRGGPLFGLSGAARVTRVYPTKMGRWFALLDEDGHLVHLAKSHPANARWANDNGYQVAERIPAARQLDLFAQGAASR